MENISTMFLRHLDYWVVSTRCFQGARWCSPLMEDGLGNEAATIEWQFLQLHYILCFRWGCALAQNSPPWSVSFNTNHQTKSQQVDILMKSLVALVPDLLRLDSRFRFHLKLVFGCQRGPNWTSSEFKQSNKKYYRHAVFLKKIYLPFGQSRQSE